MKKDNESPYRYYRVVSVKKIDRWFFDRYDHRRTHAKIYETVIRPKFGMCENTFLDYRHEPDELLELFPQSASVEFSLWLPTVQTKYMVPAEANRFSLMLWDSIDKAFRCIRRREPGCCIDADKLLTYMTLYLEERSSCKHRHCRFTPNPLPGNNDVPIPASVRLLVWHRPAFAAMPFLRSVDNS